MGSMLDTEVYYKRQRALFVSPDIIQFMKAMSGNTQHFDNTHSAIPENDCPEISLTVTSRPSVASRLWYELRWIDVDGKPHFAAAQDLQLLGWRAVTMHENARKAMLRIEKGVDADSKGFIYPDAPMCQKCSAPMYKNKKEETWCSNIFCPY
jgi:hypothetical protein